MKAAGVLLATRVALALQTTLARCVQRTGRRRPGAGRRGLHRARRRVRSRAVDRHLAGWCRTRCRAASSGWAGCRRRSSGLSPGIVGTQFIVAHAVAAVRRVLPRDDRERRRCSWGCMCCSGLRISGRRTPAVAGQAARQRGGRVLAFKCVEICRAPSSGADAGRRAASNR